MKTGLNALLIAFVLFVAVSRMQMRRRSKSGR